MKKVKLLGLGLMTIAFVACNQGPSPKEIEITKCETPKYEVLFETSSISGTQDLQHTRFQGIAREVYARFTML